MYKLIKTHMHKIRRDRRGATAVEFALFAIPLVMLILGIIEIAMLSAAGTMLQGATDDAGRLIRTGQVQSAGDPRGMFEDLLCDKVDIYLDCSGLRFEAIPLDEGFSSAGDAAARFNADGDLEDQGFDPGRENDVILIRVAYRYPLITPLIGPIFADAGARGNTKLIMSTTVIKNEPYQF